MTNRYDAEIARLRRDHAEARDRLDTSHATGEYAEMVHAVANHNVYYPTSHIVRVAANEYMEGIDPSGWAEERAVSEEDIRLIKDMLDRDGFDADDHELVNGIVKYIVESAIEWASDD